MKAVLYHKKSQLPYSFHTNSAQDSLKGVTLWSPSWGQVAFTSFQSAQEKTQTLKVPSRVRSNHGVSIQAVRKGKPKFAIIGLFGAKTCRTLCLKEQLNIAHSHLHCMAPSYSGHI